MSDVALAILGTGLVTSVGLTASAACAAMRAKITNPTETRFITVAGEWIVAHQVPLDKNVRGRAKLARMAALAIEEALLELPRGDWRSLPLFLCVAEPERPGRIDGLDHELIDDVQRDLGVRFAPQSVVIAGGRVGVGLALSKARVLLQQDGVPGVLIAATDSLLTAATLRHYERSDRLLSPKNSNGFIPGEGAGALFVGRPGAAGELRCTGLGFAVEESHIDSEKPLRGDGLTRAVEAALTDAGCKMHDIDFRIADLSGEQYYFKEASLAVLRTLRVRKAEFDVWHPAECTGESGALAGASAIALADAACRKGYSEGSSILAHMGNDGGQRVAMTLQFWSR